MRIVYVNGSYVPETEATVSVFDRGFLFADAIYEVTSVLDGKLIDFHGHMARLRRSLGELGISLATTDESLLAIHRTLVERNALSEGLIYLQVSRGAADRNFLYPEDDLTPTLVLFTQEKALIKNNLITRGQTVITIEDQRWQRCDIKTVQLLYASMVKTEAARRGADDAWMVRNGLVTEGSSNNAYIVTADNVIVTRALSRDILSGITRTAVLACAQKLNISVEERAFTVEEAQSAQEAFSTSSTGLVNPVTRIDGAIIGYGTPGPVASLLRQVYIETSRAAAI